MSNDYSWIKNGVKAVVVRADRLPHLIGEVVTIESEPEIIQCSLGEYLGVKIAEGFDLAAKYDHRNSYRLTPKSEQLAPYRHDSQTTTWEQVEKTLGVDIRQGVRV